MLRIFILFCVLLSLSACGSSKLSPLSKGDVILAFGDSLTVGVGTSPENSYPQVLAELSGLDVASAGVSGETTREGLLRLPEALEAYQPKLLILLEGGNDILRNRDYKGIEKNLDAMIGLAQNAGVEVVLVAVPEKRLFSNAAPFYRDLAEKHGLAFDGDLIAGLMRSPRMKSDSIHFNKEGYAALAEGVHELLVENGALD